MSKVKKFFSKLMDFRNPSVSYDKKYYKYAYRLY